MSFTIDYSAYDKVIIAFSGGKDSLACLLSILDTGCPKERIELWHHCIDGREGGSFFD
jgi:tRNA(Ile)-lysidine synthase TilS/MesJ